MDSRRIADFTFWRVSTIERSPLAPTAGKLKANPADPVGPGQSVARVGKVSDKVQFSVRISSYNAALSACTSAGFSTAGRFFVCLIDGLWGCRRGLIFTTLWRF